MNEKSKTGEAERKMAKKNIEWWRVEEKESSSHSRASQIQLL